MGLISNLVGRRLKKLDSARVALFDLDHDEFPVEAQPITMESAWPAVLGLPVSPEDAESITETASKLLDGLRLRLPLMCVGLLTSSHFRWTPHRTYRNSLVYRETVDKVLSDGAPKEKGIYTKFSHPSLGARAIQIEQIKRISITAFQSPDLAVLDIFLTDNCQIEEPGPWPLFEQSQIADVAPPVWLPEDPNSRYLRLSAQGGAALTTAINWSRAFDYLEIPVQTEALDESELELWESLRLLDRREPWRTLNQRLAD